MDWSQQIQESLVWIGQAFAISITGAFCTVLLLARFTRWGQQVKRISWDFFNPKRSLKPLLWLCVLVFLALFGVRLNVLFSFWYNGFYTAMQELDGDAFWFMLVVFSVLATVHVLRVLFNYYLNQAFVIRWRMWLTEYLVKRWSENRGYYRSKFAATTVDNPDQRIQQDVVFFVDNTLSLSIGLLSSMVSLFAFTIILWNLSGPLSLGGVELPRAMVFLVYLYVIVATVLAIKIGRPLVRLNFLSEQFNANFRYALMRVREYAESIAFYGGEMVERNALMRRFADVLRNMWDVVYRSLKFQGFNLGISQAAVVFPFIVQAPRLLDKSITLGDVMQTAQSFGQVEGALSFFRSAYDNFASYRAVITRLSGFLESMDMAEQLPSVHVNAGDQGIMVQNLTVSKPDATVLIHDLSFTLEPASALLVRGASGVGKTTLLRSIAGLWPYAKGKLSYPLAPASLFLSQKPYLPLGALRTALHYPGVASEAPDTPEQSSRTNSAQAIQVLNDCQLGHLVESLDNEADWSRILSLGEQQRLAVGRVLLNQPKVVFLDEASSAMDEGLEYAMYTLLRTQLPQTVFISIGHRSSLLQFHTQELILEGDGKWSLNMLH